MNYPSALAVSAISLFAATGVNAAHHETDLKAVAKGWIEASCGDRAGFMDYVKAHMADDGVWMPARYVGLGFQIDIDEMTVSMVMPDTPAASNLKVGDQFVEVNGVAATEENRDRMSFRGEPGQPVKAVIKRDGKEMDVEITRGIIERAESKDVALANLQLGDAEDWGTGTCSVEEMVQEGNVIYAHIAWTDTERDTGIQYRGSDITRFEFNDAGQVVKGWNRGESRFVLEQLGYSITR